VFRSAGFIPVERDGEIYLDIDLAMVRRIRPWEAASHIEQGIGAAGLRRLRLGDHHPQ
jgi:hypothetical protein